MLLKFLKCKNPNYQHIKAAYGDFIDNWQQYRCDCGHEFEGFVEISNDTCSDNFPAVEVGDAESETKLLPAIKSLPK